jgi:hypothetical protein
VPELNKLKELLCRTDLMPEPKSDRPEQLIPGSSSSRTQSELSKAKELNDKMAQSYGFDLVSVP